MKKSYFIQTYNLNIFLSLISISAICFGWLIKISLPNLFGKQAAQVIKRVGFYSLVAGMILLVILFILIGIEWIIRIRDKSLLCWFKSIWQTIQIRSFLKQDQTVQKTADTEEQQENVVNPVIEKFNVAVSRSVVDIKRNTIIVMIPIPKTQQSQEVLKDIQSQIKDEIASKNINYYFSEVMRVGKNLFIIGNRR